MGKVIINEIQETLVEVKGDTQCIFSESDIYTPYTNDSGVLYKALVKEYGRCLGKLYRDYNGQTLVSGWIFEKRMQYDDSDDTFLRHAWISVSWGYQFGA